VNCQGETINPEGARAYEKLNVDDEMDAVTKQETQGDLGPSNGFESPNSSIGTFLNQLFIKSYRTYRYSWNDENARGSYDLIQNSLVDNSHRGGDAVFNGIPVSEADRFPLGEGGSYAGVPPVVRAVKDCVESNCAEGEPGTFTVNEKSDPSSVITSYDGHLLATVKLYAYAQPNQMPIRNIVVDWGDGDQPGGDEVAWPLTSFFGSRGDSNFYKNHRGVKSSGSNESWCDNKTWGRTGDSCDQTYLTFVHDYICSSAAYRDGLPACPNDPSTTTTSPCKMGNYCVFRPRVYVKDNWGWCTGTCNDPMNGDGKDQCYGAECNPINCPKNLDCPDYNRPYTIDPWVYYDGYIKVKPQ
jgi:hypothetical protein